MKKDLKDFVYIFEATAGELAMLVGPLDENLRQIETAFDAKISRRGNNFRIAGAEAPKAFAVLQACAARVHAGEEISVNDVQMAVLSEQTGSSIDDNEAFMLKTRRAGLQPRTPNQKKYLRAIMQTDVVFGVGPAGTGKTYLCEIKSASLTVSNMGTERSSCSEEGLPLVISTTRPSFASFLRTFCSDASCFSSSSFVKVL